MEKATKITKAQVYTAILDVLNSMDGAMLNDTVSREDAVSRIQKDIEQLSERKSTPKKSNSAQYSGALLDVMEDGKMYSVSDLVELFPRVGEKVSTTQSIRAILTPLTEGGMVTRVVVKSKPMFYITGTIQTEEE